MKHARLIGRLVALLMTPSLAIGSELTDRVVFDNYKQYVEKENGISCQELSRLAIQFVERDIRPLVIAGRNGKDWVARSNKGMLAEIRTYKAKTFRCHLVKSNADRMGIEMDGNFNASQRLFSALDIFLTSYSGEPPSARGLKPGAFEEVDTNYRNLTSRSRPTR